MELLSKWVASTSIVPMSMPKINADYILQEKQAIFYYEEEPLNKSIQQQETVEENMP